jgi:hypothetical protein
MTAPASRDPRRDPETRRPRAGFSMLEVQVAFVLLGIALTGVGPLIVMQLKLSKKIERGFNPQTAYFRPGSTFYLIPRADAWERKLGVAATFSASNSSSASNSHGPAPAYAVTIVAPIEKALGSEAVTVHVKLVQLPPQNGGGG